MYFHPTLIFVFLQSVSVAGVPRPGDGLPQGKAAARGEAERCWRRALPETPSPAATGSAKQHPAATGA